jgi:hypothetical protein
VLDWRKFTLTGRRVRIKHSHERSPISHKGSTTAEFVQACRPRVGCIQRLQGCSIHSSTLCQGPAASTQPYLQSDTGSSGKTMCSTAGLCSWCKQVSPSSDVRLFHEQIEACYSFTCQAVRVCCSCVELLTVWLLGRGPASPLSQHPAQQQSCMQPTHDALPARRAHHHKQQQQ